jgi:hypothetical protein
MLRFAILAGCVVAPFAAFIVCDWQMPHRIDKPAPPQAHNIEPIQWRGQISTETSGG